jgi:hypothetical protein
MRPEITASYSGPSRRRAFRQGLPATGPGFRAIARFILGAFAMIGALVFLGCQWRAILRWPEAICDAIFGILGLIAGHLDRHLSLPQGLQPGPQPEDVFSSVGLIMPLVMLGFLVLL